MMKCDKCNRPAVVHEVTISSGVKSELHLCEVHAREAGLAPGHPGVAPLMPDEDIDMHADAASGGDGTAIDGDESGSGTGAEDFVTKLVIQAGTTGTGGSTESSGQSGSDDATGGLTISVARACPTCGLRFTEFRSNGILGCPECYRYFGRHLKGVIERAQAGGSAHVGKCPRHTGARLDRRLLVQRLLHDLDQAVDCEEFERAAQLRDRLRDLGNPAMPGRPGERHH